MKEKILLGWEVSKWLKLKKRMINIQDCLQHEKKSTNKQYVPNSLEAKKCINSGKLRNYLKLAETMGKEHGR